MTLEDRFHAMPPSRRALLAAALSTAALEAAGCARRVNPPLPASVRGLDLGRLAKGFAPLAARAAPGVFNLGVMTLDTLAAWCANENGRFPLQGLATAPVAAAALAAVDAGRLRLNDVIRIRDVDLSPPPSRINAAFPPGVDHLDLRAADLIALALQEGDNTAGDRIMAEIGGPGAVTAWLRGHDIKDMRVDRYQREAQPALFGLESFRAGWKTEAAWGAARGFVPPALREGASARFLADPRDTTSAQAALNFLNQLSAGRLLSPASTRLMLRLMSATARPGPLRAGLPAKTALAQQSGASPTDLGLTAGAGAMGIATLPGGRRLAVVTLLAGSVATAAQRNALFAQGARLAVSALR
jgi:beta-lactamase class A